MQKHDHAFSRSRRIDARIGLSLTFLLFFAVLPPVALAAGLASGQLAIVNSADELHGYSGVTGLWSSTPLDGELIDLAASEYLGLAVTTTELNLFKPATDRWLETSYIGTIEGYDVQGAAAAAWTSQACYGISTVWGTWREEELLPLENVLGGGSASNFAIVWTDHRALAYSGATGEWVGTTMPAPAITGVAIQGIGLVLADRVALVFSPGTNSWIPHSVDYPSGVSAQGSGNVALLWSPTQADAYSGVLSQWSHHSISDRLLGGTAAGEVALVWGANQAHVYLSTTGEWSTFDMVEMMHADADSDLLTTGLDASSTFQVGPNPCVGSRLTWTLPGTAPWSLEIYDLNGRLVSRRSFDAGELAGRGRTIEWQPTDSIQGPLSAGTYWVRATSGDRLEARRFVVLP